ncbi:MAG: sigma-70 family RNA polymerase sigma factor [Oscillospiraceae bacterium]|nr:sigma-70 family RNA polymerase sigma factor [Oscillospiraceae bacterium]MBR2889696.1 sigma-70 family RNA polymerase sigma factor [Oscillospiraceae bacterium]
MTRNTLFEDYEGPRLPREVQLRRIRRVMEQELTPTQREIFQAYYFENKTMLEIANQRGISRSSVHRTLQRAEYRCRRSLKY